MSFSAHQILRSQTEDAHKNAEKAFTPFIQTQSKEEYAHQLSHFAPLIAQIEDLMMSKQHLIPHLDMGKRLRYHLLQADLDFLNHSTSQKSSQSPTLPHINSKEELLGMLYVLEGSKLGGQIITKILSKNLGITAQNGSSFFYGQGEKTAAQWKEFLTVLENEISDQSAADVATESAKQTFQLISRWMLTPFLRLADGLEHRN